MYDHQLFPIAMHQVDWATYQSVLKKYIGFDPTKGVGDLKLPVAFNNGFKESDTGLYQSYLAFLFITDYQHAGSLLLSLCAPGIVITRLSSVAPYFIYVIGGPIAHWRTSVEASCKENITQERRVIANMLYKYINQAGYKFWDNWRKRKLSDGTFIMEPR